MSKMRITLSERADEIRGTIELPADPGFVLEGIALVIRQFAETHKVPPAQVVQDLFAVVMGVVK